MGDFLRRRFSKCPVNARQGNRVPPQTSCTYSCSARRFKVRPVGLRTSVLRWLTLIEPFSTRRGLPRLVLTYWLSNDAHWSVNNGSRILLVEDEDGVRRFMTAALRTSGYSTMDACDADVGLRAFLDHAEEIDLVLSDVVMPHPGPEMVEKI